MARTYIKNGYRKFANSGKSVHRWMGAKKLGRPLNKGEVVHHKNMNKLDNSRSNLWVFTGKYGQKKHFATHVKDKNRTGRW